MRPDFLKPHAAFATHGPNEGQCEKGPPVDCELTTWAAWSACSASCGGGESRRSRTVRQEAYDGGFGCQEPLEETTDDLSGRLKMWCFGMC